MSNTELITCDYLGCTKPFAYRRAGFNLCYAHLHEGDKETPMDRIVRIVRAAQPVGTAKPESEKEGEL